MTESAKPEQDPVTPTRRERLKPLELLGFSAVLAAFAGLIVLMATRDIVLTSVAAGVAFIVSVMFVALVGLGRKPSEEDLEARKDLQRPSDDDWH
ncbi:ABC transporter ATP-binding protein [Leucobacter sp. GX24907]